MGKANAVMQALQYSVVMKRELWKTRKVSIYLTVLIPISTIWYRLKE